MMCCPNCGEGCEVLLGYNVPYSYVCMNVICDFYGRTFSVNEEGG